MRINDENMIELAVNEIFDYEGTTMMVMADTEDVGGCVNCDFYKTRACLEYECSFESREDETDVHFEKLKGGENENQ